MKVLYNLSKLSIHFLLFVGVTASCTHMDPKPLNAVAIRTGTITDRDLSEVSGITVSRINKDIFWVINDSGNSASVYALNSKGKLLDTIEIQGVSNNDWEDIASFEYEGKPYILIADVGDNFARRSKCFLHFIEEPDIEKLTGASTLSVKPSWSITYTYEDGPRDCESVAVDTVTGKILLLSKRDVPPVLYELPLTGMKNTVAKRLTEIKPLPRAADVLMDFSLGSNMTTGMDISADGLSAAVLTYGNAFYYEKKPSEKWSHVFKDTPKEIIVPPMRQAESICFGRDGLTLYITTEQLPAPMFRIDLKK
jgi:hypothetical protein